MAITKEEVDKLKKFYDETRQEFGKQLLRELLAEREQSSELDRMLSESLPVDSIIRVFAFHSITLED